MRRRVVAILITAMAMLAGPVARAQADLGPPVLKLVSAEVLARGAAARLTFDLQCEGGALLATFSMTLAQPRTVSLKGGHYTNCGPQVQKVSFVVFPEPGAPVFKQGKASLRGDIRLCTQPHEAWPTVCDDSPTTLNFTTRLSKGGEDPPPPSESGATIRIVSATSVSEGAAVQVVVDGSVAGGCHNGYYGARLSVLISQRVRRTTTQSSANVGVDCEFGNFRYTLLLPVQPGQDRFQAKRAYIQAEFFIVYAGVAGSFRTIIERIPKLTVQAT
jgi:hypothetical protein